MERNEWGGCITVGTTVILVGALLKLIKTKDANKLNSVMKRGVNEDNQENNEMVARYKRANQPQDINHEAIY
jgi:hypothetical protein